MLTECRCPQCEAEYERDEYEDAPEIEWDTPSRLFCFAPIR